MFRAQWIAAGKFSSGIEGCCFYHAQDLEGAMQSGTLQLAFSGGMYPEQGDRKANTTRVGNRIVKLLRAQGLDAQWSGNHAHRITVKLGQWRKRSPGD